MIDNGLAPDGTRYEWVAFRCKVDLRDEGQATNFRGFGLSLDWPGVSGHEHGGSCEGRREEGEKIPLIGTFGVSIVPSQFKGVARPDMVVEGTVNAERAHAVRVVYRDADGRKRDLPVDFARVEGRLRKQAGPGAPLATFVAFVPGEQAARDRLEDCLDLRAVETVPGHHPAERCAARRPDVQAFRRRLAKCGAGVPARDLADQKRISDCVGSPPPSPVEVIVSDRDGRRIGKESYPMPIPAPTASVPSGTPKYRGQGPGKHGRRPAQPGADGRPVVLVAGRTPDGAPYEYFTEKVERRDGSVYSFCLTHWYPYVAGVGASGSCGRGFPPTKAYGKHWPAEVMARSFGFLGSGEPATAYLSLEGYARPNVARVRVVYRDGKGGKRDAPVEFVRVRGALRERVGSEEPFGFFVTFLPPSIRRYYRGPGDRAQGTPAIEIVAYDDRDREVGRFKHRN